MKIIRPFLLVCLFFLASCVTPAVQDFQTRFSSPPSSSSARVLLYLHLSSALSTDLQFSLTQASLVCTGKCKLCGCWKNPGTACRGLCSTR